MPVLIICASHCLLISCCDSSSKSRIRTWTAGIRCCALTIWVWFGTYNRSENVERCFFRIINQSKKNRQITESSLSKMLWSRFYHYKRLIIALWSGHLKHVFNVTKYMSCSRHPLSFKSRTEVFELVWICKPKFRKLCKK